VVRLARRDAAIERVPSDTMRDVDALAALLAARAGQAGTTCVVIAEHGLPALEDLRARLGAQGVEASVLLPGARS
jgi:hypothetical protein